MSDKGHRKKKDKGHSSFQLKGDRFLPVKNLYKKRCLRAAKGTTLASIEKIASPGVAERRNAAVLTMKTESRRKIEKDSGGRA